MLYAKKVVLHCPDGYISRLDTMVGEFFRDGVKFVAAVGKEPARKVLRIDRLCQLNRFLRLVLPSN